MRHAGRRPFLLIARDPVKFYSSQLRVSKAQKSLHFTDTRSTKIFVTLECPYGLPGLPLEQNRADVEMGLKTLSNPVMMLP